MKRGIDMPTSTEKRVKPALTPEEARRKRSTNLLGSGAIAFVWAFLAAIGGGNVAAAMLLGLLGIGLIVAGLITR